MSEALDNPNWEQFDERIKRRRKLVIIVVALYAVTWIGGWRAHVREMAADAQRRYERARSFNVAVAQHPTEKGYSIQLREGGPTSGVEWCVPVIPGVCLANSFYSVGPLYAAGTTKLVVYYGIGSTTVWNLGGWYA